MRRLSYDRLRRPKLVNYVLYQLGWTVVVVGAARGYWVAGTIVGCALIALHLAISPRPAAEIRLIGVAALLGLAIDSGQLALGTFRFASGQIVTGMAPLWILVMWAQFATTLNYCMSWLRGRPLLSAAAGLVGGPLAFWAGERLGAIVFTEPRSRGYVVLALLWAAALPALAVLGERWKTTAGPSR